MLDSVERLQKLRGVAVEILTDIDEEITAELLYPDSDARCNR